MKRLLTHCEWVFSANDQGEEFADVDILIENGRIMKIGKNLQADGAIVENMKGRLITPGLVNTHHHLFQTITKAVPASQDALLFGWLQQLYPIWSRMRPPHFYAAVQTGIAELLLSGCTMSSDHHYLFPNGTRLEDSIEAARDLGIRFHATRGAMSIGESQGGLPPDILVEDEPRILKDMQRLIESYHDESAEALLKIAVAPCSPFSVSQELMRDSAILAREYGVMMHTHLAENEEDIDYSLAQFGLRPGDYAQELGWVGDDVWHAHCVRLDESEISLFAHTKTGIAHCPCSNCRLGSGIAPIRKMRDAGVPIGLGVDGTASNDSAHILLEARQAMLLQRVAFGADKMSAREALTIATRGGAQVLGRGAELGQIREGFLADLCIWNIEPSENLAIAGAWDPIAALVLCGPFFPETVIVHGENLVHDGELVRGDRQKIGQAIEIARQEIL